MVTPDEIKKYIEAGLACDLIHVDGDGHHFETTIVSAAFHGLNRIKRHQLVYQILGKRMEAEIHALSMKIYSPEEWHAIK
jgi:acid stress-induced BolA-like protein IbaG/YrbA